MTMTAKILTILLMLASAAVLAKEIFSPEELYQQTVETWQRKHSRGSKTSWKVWEDFATTITSKYEIIIGDDGAAAASGNDGPSAVEIVGGIEEGILTIERIVVQQQQAGIRTSSDEENAIDASLAVLYTEYGRLLMYSSETTTNKPLRATHRCYELAKDPHTLLIGAPERVAEYNRKKPTQGDDQTLLASLFGSLCKDNAENALRNAIGLNETLNEARELLESIGDQEHKRKPKEFVTELFDSFADTFDEKLTKTLEYRVPQIVGETVKEMLVREKHSAFRNVLDAGCGTGLAGRELRSVMDTKDKERIVLVGVDASPKMLEKAERCTATRGCGLPVSSPTKTEDDPRLYDALIDLDLEEMTLENTLNVDATTTAQYFDLIVAADVFVYFGSLKRILEVFAGLQQQHGMLVFTCERTTQRDAPLGYTITSTGRFAHTKDHVVTTATNSGYTLVDYAEIVPRTEKGVAVDGHLFVFEHATIGNGGSEL